MAGVVVALAGTPAGAVAAPLGDGHVVTSNPRPGLALSCAPNRGRAEGRRPWFRGSRYDPRARPDVDGRVRWGAARLVLRGGRRNRTFRGNALPMNTPSGVFPPAAGDDARPFAGTAAAVRARDLTGTMPLRPARLRRARCLPAGRPVAIGLDGVPIYRPFSAAGRDLVARNVIDHCNGETDATGLLLRRTGSRCLDRRARRHSPLVGIARDGFRLYGRRGQGGKLLRSRDLDACHGHTHRLRIGGRLVRRYHYHVTGDFPYTLGCFRGRPSATWLVGRPPSTPSPAAPAVPPGPTTAITAAPGLYPAYRPEISDYVTRCTGAPVRITVNARNGDQVSVDRAAARSGDFTANVGVTGGERFELNVNGRVHHVRCLPSNFPVWTAERNGTPQAEFYVSTPTFGDRKSPFVAIFDNRGVPVWWQDTHSGPAAAHLLPNGNLMWFELASGPLGTNSSLAWTERRLDGSEVRRIKAVGHATDFHELVRLPNGNSLVLVYRPRDGVDLTPHGGPANATVLDAEVQEIEPDGDLAWSWNSAGRVSLNEIQRWWTYILDNPATLEDGRTAYDIMHPNSIEPDGNGLILSFRHINALLRIDKATGNITWKLGGTNTAQSLSILGDPLGSSSFGGQHDARKLSDGTITLHDNRSSYSQPPRAVRYRLNLGARTARLLESLSDPQVPDSFCCGSSRRLPGGNWVSGWGGSELTTEQTPSGAPVFRLRLPEIFSYRTIPLVPGQTTRAALRAGMDTMNPR